MRGLDVTDKKERVAEYHKETVHSFMELLAASGLSKIHLINRSHVNRRVEMNVSLTYDEIYPYITKGSLLSIESCPEYWRSDFVKADPNSFLPKFEQVFEN